MERILFLGTGGDVYTIGKQKRGSGGIIINTENIQFHIDPGSGSLIKAKENEINPRDTTCLIVTSNDINLCNDVNCMIEAMTHNGLDKKGASKKLVKEFGKQQFSDLSYTELEEFKDLIG